MPRPAPRAARRAAPLLAVSLLAAVAPAAASAAVPSTSGLGPRAGVVVADATTGKVLLSRAGSSKRIPASVTKVFTVGSALLRVGPGWSAKTRVLATGTRQGTTWDGDLYLVGGGDSTLSRAGVATLARQTAAKLGVRTVTGSVVADATVFDSWRGGARTRTRRDPDMGGSLGGLVVDRGAGTNPATRAATLLRTDLRAAGVTVGGSVKRGRVPAGATAISAVAGPRLSVLAPSILLPSDNYGAEMLLKAVASRDGVEAACRLAIGTADDAAIQKADAECPAQAAGVGAATTARGITTERQTLRTAVGFAPTLKDGSGLSRSDRVSPAQVVRLLVRLRANPVAGPTLRASLPVAGRSGTLARRMRGTAAAGRCSAKTGTINGVSALAGYCTTVKGRQVAFAILQNGSSIGSAHAFQDRFVARLARVG